MYEINYAYNEYDNRYTELAPTDLIKQLFDKMDDRNILFVPDHPYRRGQFSEGRKWLRCEMKWTAEDRDEIIDEFESLYTALEEVAAAYPELTTRTANWSPSSPSKRSAPTSTAYPAAGASPPRARIPKACIPG